MARRRTVLGIPIGKKKPSIAPKVIAAGAGLAAVPALAAARRAGGMVSSGREQVRKISDVADTASGIIGSVSEHSSTLGKVGAVIGEVRKLGGDGNGKGSPKLSHLIEEHIDVAVPRSVAYNQWTQFETFPAIVKGAESVEQKRDDRVEWTSKIGPSKRSWQGEITEQVPDERIAWRSKGGLQLGGVVTFHSLDEELTRVQVEMEYDPKGPVEHVGNLLRVQRRRVRRDLRLFKHFVELRGEETGAWRGRIKKKDEGAGGRRSGGSGSSSGRSSDGSSSGSRSSESRSSSSGSSGSRSPGSSSPAKRRPSASRSSGSSASAKRSSASRSSGGGSSPAKSSPSSRSSGASSAAKRSSAGRSSGGSSSSSRTPSGRSSNGRSSGSQSSSRSNGARSSSNESRSNGAGKTASRTAARATKTATATARKASSSAKSASKSAGGRARQTASAARKAS
jgi:uncharacterized membrane protein